MPKQQETVTVIVDGMRYEFWKDVTITRTRENNVVSECVVTLTEIGDSHHGFETMRFKLDQPAQVYLGDTKVIDGVIAVRQASFTANERGLQITILSNVQHAVVSTVETKPGQFKDQTLEQMANSVLAPHGISFKYSNGTPDGADMKFGRINLWKGETVFNFIERLARHVNVQLVDDSDGNLVGLRATGNEPVIAELREGYNIKSARAVLRDDYAVGKTEANSHSSGNDFENGNKVRDRAAEATNSAAPQNRISSFICEEAVGKQGCQMRAEREMTQNLATTIDVSVVVRGWFTDDGTPWLDHVTDMKQVTVYSPILFPEDSLQLYIAGVTSRQSEEGGSETEIQLTRDPKSPVAVSENRGAGAGNDFFSPQISSGPSGSDT